MTRLDPAPRAAKFQDPQQTADGAERASVSLSGLETLWFNTGTLCNITCANCYIESSPENDRLVYLGVRDVRDYLDQARDCGAPLREVGFTGGEPFMNPEIIDMTRLALTSGHDVLILTNAMRPMMRPQMRKGLAELAREFGPRLTLRVSLDHWSAAAHDRERVPGSFDRALDGMRWLRDAGLRTTVAGRTIWNETETETRAGYARLYAGHGFAIDADDPGQTVLFPEMDDRADVPEITTACWGILGKSPATMMCATSRMIVRRKGAARASVVACTLLPYAPGFDLGPDLRTAPHRVPLNHPHCAKFCVLGGASCSA